MQKVLTAAALIDAGLVDPLTRFTVPETLPSSDKVIHDYFAHDTLRLTLTGVSRRSCALPGAPTQEALVDPSPLVDGQQIVERRVIPRGAPKEVVLDHLVNGGAVHERVMARLRTRRT